MEIDFATDDLRSMCEQVKLAVKQLGAPCARRLCTRLADLAAATSVLQLAAGRPHPLKGERAGQFSVALHGGVRLVFVPDHSPTPKREDGQIDWAAVRKVQIIYIGDYHD